jgi:hypothetical protein
MSIEGYGILRIAELPAIRLRDPSAVHGRIGARLFQYNQAGELEKPPPGAGGVQDSFGGDPMIKSQRNVLRTLGVLTNCANLTAI